MNPLQVQVERIRRRKLLVIAITLVSVLTALGFTYSQPTMYTAKAALTTSSQNRSPDQDAFLAQGYAQYFNEQSYQELMARAAAVPPGITFSARTAATSPILYIEATGPDRELTVSTAGHLAEVFRDAVGGQIGVARQDILDDISRQVADARNEMAKPSTASDERIIILQQIFALEAQATGVKGDTTNQLKDLQLEAGVSATSPRLAVNGVLALIGGLLLGCIVALGMAGLENRLSTAQDVRERLDLETLAVIRESRGGTAHVRERAERLKGLANIVNLSGLDRPATIAITSPRHTSLKSEVAGGLAYFRALQGESTLLLQADLHSSSGLAVDPGEQGVADALAMRTPGPLDPVRVAGAADGLMVVPAGESEKDPFELFAPDRFRELVTKAAGLADLVLIDAPAVLDAAESQVVCAAAERTILVIEEGVTSAADGLEACQHLAQVGTTVLGVVIARATRRRAAHNYLQPRIVDQEPVRGSTGQVPTGAQETVGPAFDPMHRAKGGPLRATIPEAGTAYDDPATSNGTFATEELVVGSADAKGRRD